MLELAKYGHIDKWKLAFFEIETKMPCCCVNAHIHPGIEVIFFLSGKYEVYCDDVRYTASDGDMVVFRVEGDGFLYNMVRIMVGTLIYINEGKIDENDIKNIILSGDRNKAGKTVSPEGLYLNKVNY